MNSKINNLNVPNDLKTFLMDQIHLIKGMLNDDLLFEMEYLYLYYSVSYNVSDQQYSTSVILYIKDPSKESSLNELLRSAFSEHNPSNIQKAYRVRHQQERTIDLHKETMSKFIKLAQDIDEKRAIDNIEDTYKLIGKMELISEIDDRNYYSKILNLGLDLINKHTKNTIISP